MLEEKFCEHKLPVFDKFFVIEGIQYVICRECGLPIETTCVLISKTKHRESQKRKVRFFSDNFHAKELSPYCICDEPSPDTAGVKGGGPMLCKKCYKPVKGIERRG